jgi:hypothetical protein
VGKRSRAQIFESLDESTGNKKKRRVSGKMCNIKFAVIYKSRYTIYKLFASKAHHKYREESIDSISLTYYLHLVLF